MIRPEDFSHLTFDCYGTLIDWEAGILAQVGAVLDLYHDHVPAKELGLTTVRINRPSLREEVGLALPARASPDLEVSDMRSLVSALGP